MSEDLKNNPNDKASLVAYLVESQKAMQKELTTIASNLAAIKEVVGKNSADIAEIKSGITPLREKQENEMAKEFKPLKPMISDLIAELHTSCGTLSELNILMASVSGNIKTLPAIQSQIESGNAMVSKIPEKYDKLVARIEKITDGMGMPEKRSWIRSAVQVGINLGVVVVIILAAIGLYQIWLLI